MNAEQLGKIIRQLEDLKRFAHCNCAPDEDGAVRYHSNCNRHMKPKIEAIIAALEKDSIP